MKRNRIWIVLAATLLLLALVLMACADDAQGIAPAEAAPDVVEASVAAADQDEPAQDQDEPEQDEDNDEDQDQDEDKDDEGDDEDEPDDPGDEEPVLATASVVSRLSNQAGRSIVSARGNHFVVDSVPPLDNPSEELNPLDMMLSALGSCGVFVAERAAQELDIALEGAAATVEGDLDPSGVRTGEVNPRIQQFRVYLELPGANPGQQNRIVDNFEQRCPVYTTLSRAAEVEIFTDGEPGSQATEGLATATARIVLSNQPGRAIASARGNHWVIDSVPPLDGPNEERNPLDMMLGALATCGTFIYEHVALTEGIPLTAIAATVEGDLYPAGVATGEINPRLRAFRVHMQLSGATEAEAELMASEFQTRCPIYTTLVRAAPIEITTDLGD